MITAESDDDELLQWIEEGQAAVEEGEEEEWDEEKDAVDCLHDAVEKVTGTRPVRKRHNRLPTIGFIQQDNCEQKEH